VPEADDVKRLGFEAKFEEVFGVDLEIKVVLGEVVGGRVELGADGTGVAKIFFEIVELIAAAGADVENGFGYRIPGSCRSLSPKNTHKGPLLGGPPGCATLGEIF